MEQTTLEIMNQYKIITILRGLNKDEVLHTAQALYEGGIRLLEITFDQAAPAKETGDAIRAVNDRFEGKLCVGAGTVMTMGQLYEAFEAGSRYIISPDSNPEIIKETKKLGLVSMPGAMTPTEVASSYAHGADIVKIFPADNLGLSYIKALKGPLNHIPMAAVGGVNLDNIADFIKAGVAGVGIGSNIADKAAIRRGDYAHITKLAESYVAAVSAALKAVN